MSTEIKAGMYVRCPIDTENVAEPRKFILGQVLEVYPTIREVEVVFHDLSHLRKYFVHIPGTAKYSFDQVLHCPILTNTDAIFRSSLLTVKPDSGKIVHLCNELDDGYYSYYVESTHGGDKQTTLVREDRIQVALTRADLNPVEQIKAYELHNPQWYFHRHIVAESMHVLANATFGFDTLVGSRVYLLPHQIDSIMRTITEDPCRFMLADEVGLGKTIEACVMYRILEQRQGELATLIVAPESLIHQWKNELSYKFWETFEVWSGRSHNMGKKLIFPLEKIATTDGLHVLQQSWDLCILDEAHRLLTRDAEYQALYSAFQRVRHLLLLSATPIQENRTDYFKLLRLLEPRKYGNMSTGEFEALMNKQTQVRGKMHSLVRDIDAYIEEDMAEEYVEELEEIAEDLQDSMLFKLVEQIDIQGEDQGLDAVKLALAYLAESYQFERKILRNRRQELQDKMPQRSLKTISYTMSGASESYYEATVHEELLDFLVESNLQNSEHNEATNLLSAMYSSPWALLTALEKLRISSGTDAGLSKVMSTVKRWRTAAEYEIGDAKSLLSQPSRIKGRFLQVLHYLAKQPTDHKFVVFSSWTETALELESFLIGHFGASAVCGFYKGKSDTELQEAADNFQRKSMCRFMVCDVLGGEGRNFQMADEVLHVDLPWSPSDLEQRIGRLDRIGRNDEVCSVVFYAEETLEQDLFLLWHEGLNLFQESLSGLEIVLGDIHDKLLQALRNNLRFGLQQALSEIADYSKRMRKVVDQERYFDMARRLDRSVEEKLNKLISSFDREGGARLAETMLTWAEMAGLREFTDEEGRVVKFNRKSVSYNAMINSLFVPPDLEEYRKRTLVKHEIHGSFLRDYAVEREDLIFYAPGDPWFDQIVTNAMESSRGRSVAYARKAKINWKGFVFIWSVAVDPMPFFNTNKSLANRTLTQGYMPMELCTTVHGWDLVDRQVDSRRVLQEVLTMKHSKQGVKHLGQRDINQQYNVQWLRETFPSEVWTKTIDEAYEESFNEANKYFQNRVELARAYADLSRRYQGMKAAKLYYDQQSEAELLENKKINTDYNAVLDSMRKPQLRLESVAFVWLVK